MKTAKGISCQRDLMTFTLNLAQSQTWKDNIDFHKKVEHLPFQFNMGDVSLNARQEIRLFNLSYANQNVLSLSEEIWDSVTICTIPF